MYRVGVRVVDVKRESADGYFDNASLNLILQDDYLEASEKVTLQDVLKGDLKDANANFVETSVEVKKKLSGGLRRLEIWRDSSGECTEWFVENVTVTAVDANKSFLFPVLRWIRADNHHLYKTAKICCLPQEEELLEYRLVELEEKQKDYCLESKDTSLPAKAAFLPRDEIFSQDYKLTLNYECMFEKAIARIGCWSNDTWNSVKDITSLHQSLGLPEPQSVSLWKEDWYFGHQRLAGPDPTHIRLCTSIPDKLAITDDMMLPMLERLTLQKAIIEKRIFIVDHFLLHHLYCNNGHVVCAPIALFFLNSQQDLVPIAIQLFQDPGLRNPVFFPTDSGNVWTLAKLWFNNAEAQIHQAMSHYAVKHFIMEGIAVMMHRHLSEEHPIFKLLAPHFHLLISNNSASRSHILNADGPVDIVLSCGTRGLDTIMRRGLALWRMDVEGTLPQDLKSRGVHDSLVLPGYHYRDDGLLVYNVIVAYVTKYVSLYYECEDMIAEDFELQSWVASLCTRRENGGLGINGVPGQGHLSTYDQLVQVTASIIFTCTAGHAAVGGRALCESYSFPPAYPTALRGAPPSQKRRVRRNSIIKELHKHCDQAEVDLLQTLPDQYNSAVASVLGSRLCGFATSRLGYPQLQYISDPYAQHICTRFQEELEEASELIRWRNEKRRLAYTYLDPKEIPNTPFS